MPTIQVRFNKVNPVDPPHTLADDEVQTATNVDFGLSRGALGPRRGSTTFSTPAIGQPVSQLFRNYNQGNSIVACPIYAVTSAGTIFRGTGGAWSALTAGAAPFNALNSFREFTIIAGAAVNVKDDGTNVTDWIKQSPGKPTVTINTLTPVDLTFGSATFSVTEGSVVGGSSTCTALTDATTNRITYTLVLNSGTSVNLTTNGGNTIGNFGVHFVDLAFSDPTLVTRISQDYTVLNTKFYNYWHGEILPQNTILDTAGADPNQLIDAQMAVGTSTVPLTQEQRQDMISRIRDFGNNSLAAVTRLSANLSPWAVARPDFGFVGTYVDPSGADTWGNIFAIKYTIECAGTCTATIANPQIAGAQNFALNDINVGYTWWQTYATLDSTGVKFGESGPGPQSGPYTCQNGNATVALTGTATGSHGSTHVITYRQGGYTRDAYAVSTVAIATATITDTMNDLQALSLDFVMPRNVYTKATFPGNIFVMAEPFESRVWIGEGNRLHWSLPGQIDTFPTSSYAQASNVGDNIKALITWTPGLIIVNQYSVYELTGNDFEGGDFTLLRSASRHGSIAPRVPIKTPHGIPLLSYDGLTMYIPGSSNEVEIPWLIAGYGDMFRGSGPNDPAALKGFRIPAINRSVIINCSCVYADQRLYLAAATGSDTAPHTVYVIDFLTQRCWWYSYGFAIYSMFWDTQDSRLMAGTDDGRIVLLETGSTDDASLVQWNAITKSWSANSDTILENLSIESDVTFTQVRAQYDTGSTTVVTTLTNTVKNWATPPLRGTFANNMQFIYLGTGTGSIYQMSFDTLAEPVRVQYYRTPYDTKGYEGDKLWDVAYIDLENRGTASGAVVAASFIDGNSVMVNTITAPWTSRQVFEFAFPPETYGRVAYTTLTALSSAVQFQVWNSFFDARQEPAKINSFRTDIESLEENICDGWDVDINPNGTCTGTVFVDGTAVSTGTYTGTLRQSYSNSLPQELYGRTLWVLYKGQGFKHYKTWFHLRAEPDRWVDYVTSKFTSDEHEWKVWKPEMNCYGNTVLSTVFVDGTAVGTYTSSSTVRYQDVFSLPVRTFGRTIWAAIHAVAGQFKYYPGRAQEYGQPGYGQPGEFEGTAEPARVTLYRTGPFPFPSSNYLKTWLPQLDPLGGAVVGTLIVDNTVLTSSTFSGDRKQWFTIGLDIDQSNAIQTGSRWEAIYSAVGTGSFKHYDSKMESEPKPFGKTVWAYSYRKLGGASQLDVGRYFSLEIEAAGPCQVEYFWDCDGTNFTFGTLTLTGGIEWFDRLALPPGMRGYLFLFRLQALTVPVKIYKVNLDLIQEGIKHLVRREVAGTPQAGGASE